MKWISIQFVTRLALVLLVLWIIIRSSSLFSNQNKSTKRRYLQKHHSVQSAIDKIMKEKLHLNQKESEKHKKLEAISANETKPENQTDHPRKEDKVQGEPKSGTESESHKEQPTGSKPEDHKKEAITDTKKTKDDTLKKPDESGKHEENKKEEHKDEKQQGSVPRDDKHHEKSKGEHSVGHHETAEIKPEGIPEKNANQTGTSKLQKEPEKMLNASMKKPDKLLNGEKPMDANYNRIMYCCDNGSDCSRLNELMTKEWDKSKPRAAVYFLTSAAEHLRLVKALVELDRHFLSTYSYPIIIFHEKDFIPHIDKTKESVKAPLYFQEVELSVPQWLHPDPPETVQCSGKDIDYRNKCRFQSKVIYKLPIVKNMEYLMRLDAYSLFTREVPYDLFDYMKVSGLKYAFPCIKELKAESPCTQHLFDSARQYMRSKGIRSNFFNKMTKKVFYNNYEIVDMSFFHGKAYRNYVNYIDLLGGIYYYGWCDSSIRSFAVTLLLPENQTKQMHEVQFVHKGHFLTNGNRHSTHQECLK